MDQVFNFEERLGIEIPYLDKDWQEYSLNERTSILEKWELMRGRIPAQIAFFESEIESLQEDLHQEEDWDKSLHLMQQVSDYASRINDLNILFRTQPDAEPVQEIAHHTPIEEHHAREK